MGDHEDALAELVERYLASDDLFDVAFLEETIRAAPTEERRALWEVLDESTRERTAHLLRRPDVVSPRMFAEWTADAVALHVEGELDEAARRGALAARGLDFDGCRELRRIIDAGGAPEAWQEVLRAVVDRAMSEPGSVASSRTGRDGRPLGLHAYLAMALARRGLPDQAAGWLRAWIASGPRSDAWDTAHDAVRLARLHRLAGRMDEAARILNGIQPRPPGVARAVAMAVSRQGAAVAARADGGTGSDHDAPWQSIVESIAVEWALLARSRGDDDDARALLPGLETRETHARELSVWGDIDGAGWVRAEHTAMVIRIR